MADEPVNNGGQAVSGGEASVSASTGASAAGGGTVATPGQENVSKINREFQEKATLQIAHERNLPYIDIAKTPLNPDFLNVVDFEAAKIARVVPFFKVGKKIRLAAEKPDKPETQKLIEALEQEGYEVDISLASGAGIDDAFKILDGTQKYRDLDIVENVEEKSISTYETEIKNLHDLEGKLDDVTAEEALNMLDIGAMKTKASDVHYEPTDTTVVVRFRIDGMLHRVFEIRPETYKKIAEQIKFKSKMQLNVITLPQDGRYVFNYNDVKVAVRCSSIPTPYGESFVCRYLPSDQETLGLKELGFEGEALTKMQVAGKITQGMVLITGPTGSGKSTTLYSILGLMQTPENKIITLEDPVEYYMPGVTQSQIDEKNNYTFAAGLRSVLRHDPDIVMLGEIRDLETAETAAQASLTGHVVLSTLHTNGAVETIPRLVNMGLPAFMVAPALHTVVGQRLVRRACSACATLEAISESAHQEFVEAGKRLKDATGMEMEIPEKTIKVHGCEGCSNTGYSGRVVISEVMRVSNEIKEMILNKRSVQDIFVQARKEGMITIKEDGLRKVAQGLTTLEEVYRVTNSSGESN